MFNEFALAEISKLAEQLYNQKLEDLSIDRRLTVYQLYVLQSIAMGLHHIETALANRN